MTIKRVVVIGALIALASIPLWAHPFNIKCPYDGDYMSFDHQVGYGRDAYCWYSHTHFDGGKSVKHEAYISCDD